MNDAPSTALASCRAAIVAVAPDAADEVVDLDLDADLWDELELDSMDQLAVLTELATATGREIPEAAYGQLRTLRALATYLAPPVS